MITLDALIGEARNRGSHPEDESLRALYERLASALEALSRTCEDDAAPERTREKARAFLDRLIERAEEHQERFFSPAFVLNGLGEALVVTGFLHGAVIETLQVGLYFWGLQQIERRWPANVPSYSMLHAEQLGEYFSRRGLKEVLARAERRAEQGRVFCLTWDYIGLLRRAHTAHQRSSADALELARTGDQPLPEVACSDSPDLDGPGPGRLEILSRIFTHELTPRQQWIYLAKNRELLEDPPEAIAEGESGEVERFLASLEETPAGGSLGWGEIAARLSLNEKSAKREYLKALLAILSGTAKAIHGPHWVPSGLVRAVLDTLAAVVRQKDLRIRSVAGHGMNALVEKWEVALRFVVNDERISV